MTDSTPKKSRRKRSENDFYETPEQLCKVALSGLPRTFDPDLILDPGFGTGIWGKVARAKYPYSYIIGVDLIDRNGPHNDAYNQRRYVDYLKPTFGGIHDDTFGLIMGNPPFKLAEEFVRQSLGLLCDDGWLVLLLRLSFLASDTRGKGLWQEHPPLKVSICAQRPSFTGDGMSDNSEYAIYYWHKLEEPEVHLTPINWINWR